MGKKHLLSALVGPVKKKDLKLLDDLLRGRTEKFSERAEEEIKRLAKMVVQDTVSGGGSSGKS